MNIMRLVVFILTNIFENKELKLILSFEVKHSNKILYCIKNVDNHKYQALIFKNIAF